MSIVQMAARKGPRRTRSPEYDFHLRQRAFVIQPFMFHPVRPGETLKSLMWQARVVTDPLANPLMGWHLEYYLFYVQLQDCVPTGSEDTALAALWDPTKNFAAAGSFGTQAARLEMNTAAGAVNKQADFTYAAYRRIIEEYFREEGENWNDAWKMSGALALARRPRKDFFESAGAEFGASDVTINVADGLTVHELMDSMAQYAMLMDTSMGAVTTFEDYLASQGQGRFSDVKRAYRPELLRVVKEWTYPTNTVDPATGTPSSACSWSFQGRADKDRYFKEPGFVVGLCVARPKTLLKYANDPAGGLVLGRHWLPQQYVLDAVAGIYELPAATGVPGNPDSRDLFEYGGQFTNFDMAAYKANQIGWSMVVGGSVNYCGVYPVEADINANVWKAAASNTIRQDGKLEASILTDLPEDPNQGASLGQEPSVDGVEISDARSIGELAEEYVAKLKERKAGKLVKLPNIRATLEALQKAQ